MSRVVVVGGGLAGLLSAYRLIADGNEVTVCEAAPDTGGMIASVEFDGVRVDSGAEAFAVRGGAVSALCAELGLETAGPLGTPHIWWPHGAWPMAEGVIGIPASLTDPALQALDEAERALAARDLELGAQAGADASTVGELVRARLGEGALRKLVSPVTEGVYATKADQLALAAAAPGLLAALAEQGSLLQAVGALRRPGAHSVEQPVGGMFRLVEALEARTVAGGGTVRRQAAVSVLRRSGGGFAVGLPDGRVHEAERVVLAVPAAVAARLLGQLGAEITAPPVKTTRQVILAATTPGLADAPVGSGILVAERDPAVRAKAMTHYSAKWPWASRAGAEILRLSYPEDVFATRAEVLADASRLLGVEVADDEVTGLASVGWESMPTRIDAAHRDHLLETAAQVGVDMVGAWLDGNGIAAVVAGTQRVLR